jgi:3-hydroxyisobutyrate dehydrogenase
MKNIAFIGLGNMGSKMSLNLTKAGYKVFGYDVNESVVDKLSSFGIIKEKSLVHIAKDKDIIITMLPNGKIVEDVLKQIINHVDNKTIFIDCSTIDVKTTTKLNSILSKKGFEFLDAPVSGGTTGAEKGTLTFMVGGKEKSFNNVAPLFDVMGAKSVFCGKSGSGQATKLCNNMLLAITMIGVSESFNMAKNLDLNLKTLFEVVSTATGSCWAVNNYCPIPNVGPLSPADNDYLGGFSAQLMSKDLKLAINAAENCGSKVKLGEMAEKLFTLMANGENGHKDFSAIINEIN